MSARDPAWDERWRAAKGVDMLELARRLGARLRRSGIDWIGPCPAGCAKRDGFVVTPGKRLFLCRPSGAAGGAIDLVVHVQGVTKNAALEYATGLAETAGGHERVRIQPSPPAAPPPDDAGTTTRQALMLWREAADPRQTLVRLYLASRGLRLGDDLAGDVLRWHSRVGAMLALFRNIETGQPQAVSRTFLDREGRKIGRKFLGPVSGVAIMLDRSDIALHVGEGVETCMAARQLGLRPCWALGSAGGVTAAGRPFGGIAAFPVLGGVRRLTLLQENDGGHSARACEVCAARWHAAGREVIINEPERGKDLNDAIRLRSAS